jgi:hypothetical protein
MNGRLFDSCVVAACAAIVVGQWTMSSCGQDLPEGDLVPSSRNDLESAWAERAGAITSLTLTAAIDETIVGSGEDPAEQPGPFDVTRPKDDQTSKVVIEYAHDEREIGLTRRSFASTGDEQAEKAPQQQLLLTFDGQINSSLCVEEARLPMGTIKTSRSADSRLYVHVDFLAVSLWLHPKKMLRDIGWSVDTMTVEKNTVDVSGVACRRIRIPRNTNRWTSAIDVDPARDFVPVQWQTWLDGHLSMKLTIEYEDDKKVGPVVKGWSYAHYKMGAKERFFEGTVTQYDVNSDVPNSRFKIEFPVGTHVSEETNGNIRYYIQQVDRLVPIKEGDYGRIKTAAFDGG